MTIKTFSQSIDRVDDAIRRVNRGVTGCRSTVDDADRLDYALPMGSPATAGRWRPPRLNFDRLLSVKVVSTESHDPTLTRVEYRNSWSGLSIGIVLLMALSGAWLLGKLGSTVVAVLQFEVPYRLIGGLVGTPVSVLGYNLGSFVPLAVIGSVLLGAPELLSRFVHNKETRFWRHLDGELGVSTIVRSEVVSFLETAVVDSDYPVSNADLRELC